MMSHSKLRLWETDKAKFVWRYFWNEVEEYESPFQKAGKALSEFRETGYRDPIIPQEIALELAPIGIPEYEFAVFIDGIPLHGFFDDFDPEGVRLAELKSTLDPWPYMRIRDFGQIDFYGLVIKDLTGKFPDAWVQWFETYYIKKNPSSPYDRLYFFDDFEANKGEVGFTGKSDITKYKPTKRSTGKILDRIKVAADEISEAYDQYSGKGGSLFDEALIEEWKFLQERYQDTKKRMEAIKKERDDLQKLILSELALEGPVFYSNDEEVITTTPTGRFSYKKRN